MGGGMSREAPEYVTEEKRLSRRRTNAGYPNIQIHSMISQSFSIDPVAAILVPLGEASDEELLAEVARRNLKIRHNITESIVKETYDFGENLGKGASGYVIQVTNRQLKKDFALKVVEKNESMNDLDSMMTEIDIMKRVRHRHVVCMYELYEVTAPVFQYYVLLEWSV